jgi:hypothetical protein
MKKLCQPVKREKRKVRPVKSSIANLKVIGMQNIAMSARRRQIMEMIIPENTSLRRSTKYKKEVENVDEAMAHHEAKYTATAIQ